MDDTIKTSNIILLLNKSIYKHTSIFFDKCPSKYPIELLELIIHYQLTDLLFDYLCMCIMEVIKNPENILRSDDNYSIVLTRFVEICLDNKFDNININDNLLGNLFIICSDAPKVFRNVCNKLLDEANKLDTILGYRAVCTLVIFRYYLAKIIIGNITDRSKIMECKTFQKNINFDMTLDENHNKSINSTILSLIKIITAEEIGCDIIFTLSDTVVNKYIGHIVNVCSAEFNDDLEIIRLCNEICINVNSNEEDKINIYATQNKYTHTSKSMQMIRRKSYVNRKSINIPNYIDSSTKSIEITKYLLNMVDLSIYEEIIDNHKITHTMFFGMDKNKLLKIGIINKKHQKIIIHLIKKCNKLMDYHDININNTDKLLELLMSTTI